MKLKTLVRAEKQKPPADDLEEKAKAIGKRLMERHPFMQIRQVDVVEGVALVDRVDLGSFPCVENSTAE